MYFHGEVRKISRAVSGVIPYTISKQLSKTIHMTFSVDNDDIHLCIPVDGTLHDIYVIIATDKGYPHNIFLISP